MEVIMYELLIKINPVWRGFFSRAILLFVLQHVSVLREKSIMWENQYFNKGILHPPPLRIDFMQEC